MRIEVNGIGTLSAKWPLLYREHQDGRGHLQCVQVSTGNRCTSRRHNGEWSERRLNTIELIAQKSATPSNFRSPVPSGSPSHIPPAFAGGGQSYGPKYPVCKMIFKKNEKINIVYSCLRSSNRATMELPEQCTTRHRQSTKAACTITQGPQNRNRPSNLRKLQAEDMMEGNRNNPIRVVKEAGTQMELQTVQRSCQQVRY